MQDKMDSIFQIGTFCFRIVGLSDISIPENFLIFKMLDTNRPEYTYSIRIKEIHDHMDGQLIAKRPDLSVYKTESGECRLIGMYGTEEYYALYREQQKNQAEIILSPDYIAALQYDTVFTSLFALERHMILRDSLILHCAYMVYKGKAILFSAPSETGKSTQADLWERYRGSHTINGDRALLRKEKEIWTACGWPVCGSSEICEIGDTPIYAIVMLKQGKNNHVELLPVFQAFTQIYAQVTINQWNKEFIQQAISCIENLIKQVPVYQLTCNISEEAVECLEKVLFPGI